MRGSLVGIVVLGLVVVVALLGFGSYVSTKNHLVQLNENVQQAYSQVDIVQQRRLDLIPNLVASVKGYVKEEETGRGAESVEPPAGDLSQPEGQRAVRPSGRRAGRHGEPYRGGAESLQRFLEGVQRLRTAVPEQHLGRYGGVPQQGRSVLPWEPGQRDGANGGLQQVAHER